MSGAPAAEPGGRPAPPRSFAGPGVGYIHIMYLPLSLYIYIYIHY